MSPEQQQAQAYLAEIDEANQQIGTLRQRCVILNNEVRVRDNEIANLKSQLDELKTTKEK